MATKQEIMNVKVGDSIIIFEDIEIDGNIVETARIDYEVLEVMNEVDTQMREQLYIAIRPLASSQLLPTAEVYFYLDTGEFFLKSLLPSNNRVRNEMNLIELKKVEIISKRT